MNKPLKRVVVTGLGALTPLGNSVSAYWEGLLNGVSGADSITLFDASKFKTQFACELKGFNPEDYFDRKEARKLDRFSQLAVVAASQAVEHAKLNDETINKDRVGVIWGSGIGGMTTFMEEVRNFYLGDGTPRFTPYFIPRILVDIASGIISIKYGLRGVNFCPVSACATSNTAIIEAFNYITWDKADMIITGGSEAAINQASIGGFSSAKALSTRNDSPETASRPFDVTRDGFVMGEGAAVFILERYDLAVARGAKILGEILGAGSNADAHHITAPAPGGTGAIACMNLALEDAGLTASDISLVNAHGTSTPLNDAAEAEAMTHVFGARGVAVTSGKGVTGHALGAAGALEAAQVLLSMEKKLIPPTAGTMQVDPAMTIDLVTGTARAWTPAPAISNNFGFGGHNGSVIIGPGE